jgi:uncharacterized protein YjiS (DUF1127 family)
MIRSFLNHVRSNRAAARNYRVLSALDDAALSDIGLDRRTLHAFCRNGCTHTPAPPSRPGAPWAAAMPGTLGLAVR